MNCLPSPSRTRSLRARLEAWLGVLLTVVASIAYATRDPFSLTVGLPSGPPSASRPMPGMPMDGHDRPAPADHDHGHCPLCSVAAFAFEPGAAPAPVETPKLEGLLEPVERPSTAPRPEPDRSAWPRGPPIPAA